MGTTLSAVGFPGRLFRHVAGLAFPDVCPLCLVHSAAHASVCASCTAELDLLSEPRCAGCGGSVDGILELCGECLNLGGRPWRHAVSAFPFGGRVRQAIHGLKYQRHSYVAPWLGTCMAHNWKQYGWGRPDVVVPIPLHWTRQYRRGYNQAGLLAQTAAGELDLPCRQALRRRRRTAQQAGLDAGSRQRNLAHVFAVKHDARIERNHVLLVDDVLTTGATLADATRVLINAGCAAVSVLTAARG